MFLLLALTSVRCVYATTHLAMSLFIFCDSPLELVSVLAVRQANFLLGVLKI